MPFFSSEQSTGPQASTVLEIRKSPHKHSAFVVHPVGYPPEAPPLYTLAPSRSERRMEMYDGMKQPNNLIGTAKFHLFSSTMEMTVRGQEMKLKENQLTGNYKLTIPAGKSFKWVTGKFFSSDLELVDEAGVKIASLKSAGSFLSENRKLEIYVPCDPAFMEMILFSSLTARKRTKDVHEAIAEGVSASAG